MSDLTDRVSYLRGLAEGLRLDDSRPEGTLIGKMLELLDAFAKDNDALHQSLDELNEYVESIDDDLADMEEYLFDDEEEDAYDDDEDEEDEDGDEDDQVVVYECPHCGNEVTFEIDGFDFEEENLCPSCGKPLFPTDEEEEEEKE